MGILNIENRTENWMTARFFCRLPTERQLDFVNSLEIKSGSKATWVKMELFWRGVRDYRHTLSKRKAGSAKGQRKKKLVDEIDEELAEEFWNFYKCCFGDLRGRVCRYQNLQSPKCPENYGICEDYRIAKKQGLKELLYNNLRNTEIDIVFETDNQLFVGEAKYESDFGADGKLVLVHQIIRQYVTTSLLIKVQRGREKKVVPFLIVGDRDWAMKTGQVGLMRCRKWLSEENIWTWEKLEKFSRSVS